MINAFEEKKLTFMADIAVERGTEIPMDFLIEEISNKIRMSCQSLVGNARITIREGDAK